LLQTMQHLTDDQIDKITHRNALTAFRSNAIEDAGGRVNCTVGALRELGKNVDTAPREGLGGATPQGSGEGGLVTSGDMAKLMIGAYD